MTLRRYVIGPLLAALGLAALGLAVLGCASKRPAGDAQADATADATADADDGGADAIEVSDAEDAEVAADLPPPDLGDADGAEPDGGLPCTPEIAIATPFPDATVSGTANVLVSVADPRCVARAELWVDGALYQTDTVAPYAFAWNTATAHDNPLPAPDHALDFGYYFVDYKGADNRHEVNHYTNLYYAWAWRTYVTDVDWPPLFAVSLQNAADDGKVVHLNVEDEVYWDAALTVAAPHWDRVVRVEVADEPSWDQAETEAVLGRFRAELNERGLADRPLGIVYTRDQILTGTSLFAAGLDWVGIEAYVDVPESSPDSATNVALLEARIAQLEARIPADKDIVMVMMAYDRNGGWTNLATLVDLQEPAYLASYDNPRVVAITMFSYTRSGGSHDHPELRVPHQRIAERVLGVLVPELSNGPHTLEVRAFDGDGVRADATVEVTVENTP